LCFQKKRKEEKQNPHILTAIVDYFIVTGEIHLKPMDTVVFINRKRKNIVPLSVYASFRQTTSGEPLRGGADPLAPSVYTDRALGLVKKIYTNILGLWNRLMPIYTKSLYG
jgi:hypothetical protein